MNLRYSNRYPTLALLLWPSLFGCQPNHQPGAKATKGDPSLVLSKDPAPSKLVENGSAYDKASLDLAGVNTLVLPEDAKIEEGGREGQAEIYMEKTLLFAGHPPEQTSIRTARAEMGCAYKTLDGKLYLATYGESENKEGGTSVRLLIRLPKSTQRETRKDLSGDQSATNLWRGAYLREKPDAKDAALYDKAGWKAIPSEPDPTRTARSLGQQPD